MTVVRQCELPGMPLLAVVAQKVYTVDESDLTQGVTLIRSLSTVAITGASGYIGKFLVAELQRLNVGRIKVLSRYRKGIVSTSFSSCVEIIEGDLCDPESIRGFLEPGCTVVNLAYLFGASEDVNLSQTINCLLLHVVSLT